MPSERQQLTGSASADNVHDQVRSVSVVDVTRDPDCLGKLLGNMDRLITQMAHLNDNRPSFDVQSVSKILKTVVRDKVTPLSYSTSNIPDKQVALLLDAIDGQAEVFMSQIGDLIESFKKEMCVFSNVFNNKLLSQTQNMQDQVTKLASGVRGEEKGSDKMFQPSQKDTDTNLLIMGCYQVRIRT